VLLVLAPGNKDHRMRIHVGYGLEGDIRNAIAKRILVEQMRPALEPALRGRCVLCWLPHR
jgi:uncharacterized membrane protein YgcG